MLVNVSLFLESGQHHKFICDDGDPDVVALVSALSNPNQRDDEGYEGIIQLDLSLSGRRLFIKLKSLVGVELSPILSQEQIAKLTSGPIVQNRAIPPGAYTTPSSVVMEGIIPSTACEDAIDAWSNVDNNNLQESATVTTSIAHEIEQFIRKTRSYLSVPDALKTTIKYTVHRAEDGFQWPTKYTSEDCGAMVRRSLWSIATISLSDVAPLTITLHDNSIEHAQWVKGKHSRSFDLPSRTIAVFQGNTCFEVAKGTNGFVVLAQVIVDIDDEES